MANILLSNDKELLKILEKMGLNVHDFLYCVDIHIEVGEPVSIITKRYVTDEYMQSLDIETEKFHIVPNDK